VPGAAIRSTEELDAFRNFLVDRTETCEKALMEIQSDNRRFQQWLDFEIRQFWTTQKTRATEELAIAKNALARKKLSKHGDRPVDTIEEEKAVRLWKGRLELTEEKLEAIRKWSLEVTRSIQDFEGVSRGLADVVEGRPAPMIRVLDKAIDAINRYLALDAPMGAAPELMPATVVQDDAPPPSIPAGGGASPSPSAAAASLTKESSS
jgi:hypothetical protein